MQLCAYKSIDNQWANALLWGNCKAHFHKAFCPECTTSKVSRCLHFIFTILEAPPLIGQGVSIIESLINSYGHNLTNLFKTTLSNVNDQEVEKIGGFKRERNTCFIAAALQMIRNIPDIRSRLVPSFSINKFQNESPEQFNLRLAIKNKLFEVLQKTDHGQTVEARHIEQLHQLLHNYSPEISSPGSMGDVGSFVTDISTILEINSAKIFNKTPSAFFKDPGDSFGGIASCNILEFKYAHNNFEGITIKEEPKIHYELENPYGDSIKLVLVGAITAGNHAIAYVKNPKGWTCCNDADISYLSKFPHNIKMANLFFKRIRD